MKINYFKLLLGTSFLFFVINLSAQNPSSLYQNWVDAQTNNTTPILPTFSYAGYHNGEIGLPSSFSQEIYDVTKSPYNAIANDNKSDKEAIKKAIADAEANPNGGIIFFPPGRFIVNDANPIVAGVDADDPSEVIRISKSNIIIKGSGSGVGGTELYQKSHTTHPDMATKDWSCPYLFLFWNGEDSANSFLTNVTANANREAHTVQVASTSNISIGQWVELYVNNTNETFVAEELYPHSKSDFYQPENLKIANNGVEVREIHKVVSKTSNSITFKEPIHRAVNASYNWKINNFRALEEVGVQDLKYTGGFIWKHLHHQAPQEIYPGEGKSGPHAFLSSSGWGGIQFNHVVNGWIKNVEFSNMSQVAQFKFSANSTAIDNKYTGNPGHNYISTNSSTGCFIGRNNDQTTDAIWHGCGVNATSIGNVFWRNESPQNGNSGMEMHASQPRSTLFDVCKGGVFFNQGGSTRALPNHLKNMVLWNFEGVSYQSTNVKSFRPNSETKYAKFIMPIISGLKGFTMSTEANQYQENESPGIHVDEESLYEKQLEYRLGSLPSWVLGKKSVSGVSISSKFLDMIEGDTFQISETVSPNDADDKTVTWNSSNTNVATVNSVGEVTAINPGFSIITVTTNDNNYTATSIVNVNNVALNKTVTVSSEQTTPNSNLGSYAIDGDINTRWSAENFPQWLEIDLGVIRKISSTEIVALHDRAYQFVIETKKNSSDPYVQLVNRSSNTDSGSVTNPITDSFSVINARYIRITFFGADVYTGQWTSIPEFRVYAESGSLGIDNTTLNKIKIFPNPFSSEIKIINLENKFDEVLLFDAIGRVVVSKKINGLEKVTLEPNFKQFSKGIYFLKLKGDSLSKEYKLIKN